MIIITIVMVYSKNLMMQMIKNFIAIKKSPQEYNFSYGGMAEWSKAIASKAVISVIPGSWVRIPFPPPTNFYPGYL